MHQTGDEREDVLEGTKGKRERIWGIGGDSKFLQMVKSYPDGEGGLGGRRGVGRRVAFLLTRFFAVFLNYKFILQFDSVFMLHFQKT